MSQKCLFGEIWNRKISDMYDLLTCYFILCIDGKDMEIKSDQEKFIGQMQWLMT